MGNAAKENLTQIRYWADTETPDNTGWYICHYGTVDDMLANSPEDAIGPYETQAEATRVFTDTSSEDKLNRPSEAKAKPYDPRTDSTPASASTAPSEADPSEELLVELQQAQELRDVSPEIQSD